MPPKKGKGNPAAPTPAAATGTGFNFVSFFTYSVVFAVLISYSARVHDPESFKAFTAKYPALMPLEVFYQFVDDYSPFHEFINDLPGGEKKAAPSKPTEKPATPSGGVILTKEELALYDGSEGSKGVYLAILGQVFDVSKGKEHYGQGGGYGFFSGRDGSRAFVSGQFDEEGLIDDVSGLSHQDYIGLQEWVEFYHKDYTYVGKVVGNFYDENGKEKQAVADFTVSLMEARKESNQKSAERKMFPPCNTEWSKKKGHRVWCTAKTGGEDRGWIGRPRQLFLPGRTERCACIKDFGPPSTDPSAKGDVGDLSSPHVREYENCDPEAVSCMLKPPQKDDEE